MSQALHPLLGISTLKLRVVGANKVEWRETVSDDGDTTNAE